MYRYQYVAHYQSDPTKAKATKIRWCYLGKKNRYREVSGQAFWKELTGDNDFYLKIIRLMRDIPIQRKIEYKKIWDAALNRFEEEFMHDFCLSGEIDWEKLTRFVSENLTSQGTKQKKLQ